MFVEEVLAPADVFSISQLIYGYVLSITIKSQLKNTGRNSGQYVFNHTLFLVCVCIGGLTVVLHHFLLCFDRSSTVANALLRRFTLLGNEKKKERNCLHIFNRQGERKTNYF